MAAVNLPTHVANHPVAAILVEVDSFRIRDANKSACKFLGLSKDKLQGRVLSDFCDSKKLKINSANASKNHGHYLLTLKNKLTQAQLISYRPSKKSKHFVLEFHVATESHDIAQFPVGAGKMHGRKVANELHKKENPLVGIVENLQNAVVFQFLLDKGGVIMSFPYVSPGSKELFGLAPQEIQEASVNGFNVVHPDDLEYMMEQMRLSKENLCEYNITHRIVVDGKVKWVNTLSKPERLADGAILWSGVTFDITERKQAEERLKTAESNLFSIVGNTDTGYVLYDTQFNVISYNGLAQMFTEKYLGKTIVKNSNGIDYFNEERQPILKSYFEKAINGETSIYSVKLGTPENPLWIFGRVFPAQSESGQVFGVILALTDITLVKESKTKLDRSQKLYESLVKSQTSFLIRTDMRGYYSFMNKRFLDHFGFTENEVLGKHSFETIHQEDWGTCERAVMDCITTPGKVVKATFRKPTKSGKFLWTEWEFVTIQNEAGELTDIQCLGFDITEKLAAEESIRGMANRLQIATQAAGLGVWEYNRKESWALWDEGMLEMFGLPPNTPVDLHSFKKWVHPEDWETVKSKLQNTETKPVNFIYRILRQNDQSLRYVQAFGMNQANSEAVIGVNMDVTEKIETEDKLKQLLNRLTVATQSGGIGVWEMDTKNDRLVWDAQMYQIFGVPPTAVLNHTIFANTVYPEDLQVLLSAMADVVDKNIAFNVTIRIIRYNDQQTRFVQAYGTFDASSHKWTGINLDITDKVEIENKLIQTSDRLKLATQSAKIGVWEWQIPTNSLIFDSVMYELYGMEDKNDTSFAQFEKCVHPDDKAIVEKEQMKALQQKGPIVTSFRIIRQADQSVRQIQCYGVFGPTKESYTGINIDVTDLKEKEKAIAAAESKIDQLEMNALRAAMNPHFLFNALNSIQYFISQNQRECAIEYLSKFAKLMRGILDSSTSNRSTIASELELVKYYVEIEQLRFENKFDFKLSVNPAVDIEMVELPALFIQPFVENAILHGLYTKPSQGLLEIAVDEDKDSVTITISDNGVGREAAAALRKANFPDHDSKGLRLMKERIELINKKQPVQVSFIDLIDGERPAGTRVTISVGKGEG